MPSGIINSESCNSCQNQYHHRQSLPVIVPDNPPHFELQLEMNHCPKHDAVARTSCRLKHILPATSSTSPCSSDPHALICLLVPRRRTGEFLLLHSSFKWFHSFRSPPIVRLRFGRPAGFSATTAAGSALPHFSVYERKLLASAMRLQNLSRSARDKVKPTLIFSSEHHA